MFEWIKSWFIKTPTYLDDLPDDVLYEIGTHLSITEIKNVLKVIKREHILEYIVPEYKILNSKYPSSWKILELYENDWDILHPKLPVNRKIFLEEVMELDDKQHTCNKKSSEYMFLSNGIDYIFNSIGLYLLACSATFNLSELAKLSIIKISPEIFKCEPMFEIACEENNIEIVEVFLESKINISQASISNLFTKACENGNLKLIKLFIRYNYIYLDDDKTILVGFDQALENKQKDVIKFLLSFDKTATVISEFNSDLLQEAYQLINE